MIDSDTVVKHQGNERKIKLLLVTKGSERIDLTFEMRFLEEQDSRYKSDKYEGDD